ncbi:MAG: hypothetical protein ACI9H8_001735 [Lysobacterales bacterium]|jgi:hypothetical protein
MDFLKSYAHQVVSYHPEKGRDELFTELYNELHEEFADWQDEHPEGDEITFLDAQKDHPIRFATRLAPEGSAYLIGPQFYYSFISALKVATVVTIGLHLFLGAISALSSGAYFGSFTRLLVAVPATLIWIYASIIGVFIALEKSGEKATWLDNWSASKLSPIDSHQPISKGETFTDLGISLLGLLWLLDIVQFPLVIGRDGGWITGWTANLPESIWLVIGIFLAIDIAYCVFRLVKNFWSPQLRYLTMIFNIAWIALLSYVASQTQLISLNDIETVKMQGLETLINNVVHGVLYVIVVILAVDTLKHGWKLLHPKKVPV